MMFTILNKLNTIFNSHIRRFWFILSGTNIPFILMSNIWFIYRCNICLKAFAQSGILQSHLAMHLDERKFVCSQCSKAFRQKSQLRLHEQRHAGINRFSCSYCNFKFLTKGQFWNSWLNKFYIFLKLYKINVPKLY